MIERVTESLESKQFGDRGIPNPDSNFLPLSLKLDINFLFEAISERTNHGNGDDGGEGRGRIGGAHAGAWCGAL